MDARLFVLTMMTLLLCALTGEAFGGAGYSGEASPGPASGLLRTVKQVHELSSQAAEQHPAIHLRGVVTTLSTWHNAFFMQDSTGGISIESDEPTGAYNGAEVEVLGVANPGLFAPLVKVLRVSVIGQGKMPKAPLFAYVDLAGGSEDSKWIAVRGVVRSAKVKTEWGRQSLALLVAVDGGVVGVQLNRFTPEDVSRYIDAVVVMRGVCTTSFNDKRQFTGVGLMVPSSEEITIEQASLADPYSLAMTPIRSLLQFKPGIRFSHRVQVSGTVTYQDAGRSLYLQDGSDGVLVETDEETSVPLGTRIAAVGFPSAGAYSPVLRQAVFRSLRNDAPIAPIDLKPTELLHRGAFVTAPYDAQLVHIKAHLVESTTHLNDTAWLLREGDTHVTAILSRKPGSPAPPALEDGSVVSVTGVLSVQVDENREPNLLRVLLRSPADVVIVKRAPWWTPGNALFVLAAVLVVTLAVALWGALLRRRVRQQTQMLRESEERFRNQAQHDALTGLVSRSYLHEQLPEAIRLAQRAGEKIALIMVDLDHFKQVNDTLGHHAGDELLCIMAERIASSVRTSDIVARMGGDEFVVLLRHIKNIADVEAMGSKVVENVSAPVEIAGRAMLVSASVGVCVYPEDGGASETLLQNADAAMYKAKAGGRNRFSVYRNETPPTPRQAQLLVSSAF